MEAKTKDLWVYIETKEDGSAKNVGLELLHEGRKLQTGGKLAAVIIGQGVEQAIRDASDYGADIVIAVEGEEYRYYTTDAYAEAFLYLAEKYGPASILIGATPDGRDLGPKMACRLGTGLTADCTSLAFDEETGNIEWTRPAFGGNLMATIICPDHRPQMGTVRPGVFKKEKAEGNQAEVIHENYHVPAEKIRTEVLEVIREAAAELVDLEGAEIIVAGGRGVSGPEGFVPVKELADVLGGAVGASRAAVDAGWISHPHQVGQTGKTVAPHVYIACGISGAIQHQAGMSGSDYVIAINKDPDAAIFDIADYGVVGDMFQVLPVLTEEIKKLKA